MSDSLIPLAPPEHVMLTAEGMREWDSWMHVGDAKPDDVYKFIEFHPPQPDYMRIERYRNSTKLWIRQDMCVAVEQAPDGSWVRVDDE